MSTLNFNKNNFVSIPPIWTCSIPEHAYHAGALAGKYLTSTLLKEFRRCPAQYHALVTGRSDKDERPAFRLGRAAHKLILEGDAAFRHSFVEGGPVNDRTGKSYSHDSRAFAEWLEECGLDSRTTVTPAEGADIRKMRFAVRAHGEAARLLREGWPELCCAALLEGCDCRARFDWLTPGGDALDLKTTHDISRFEEDAKRFGYLNQFAFYRDVAREAGAGDLRMTAVVVEKRSSQRGFSAMKILVRSMAATVSPTLTPWTHRQGGS